MPNSSDKTVPVDGLAPPAMNKFIDKEAGRICNGIYFAMECNYSSLP